MIEHSTEKLIAALIDGSISQEDHDKLQTLMKEDPEVRQVYLEHCNMSAALKWEQGSLNRESIPLKKAPAKVTPFTPYKLIALAAVLLLACLFAFQSTQSPVPQRGQKVAQVSGASGIKFKYGINGSPVQKGDNMLEGSYQLTSGLLELQFDTGAKVIFEAPAKFTLENQMNLTLNQGGITATIPDQAQGFTIKTPKASIMEKGTEFGIYVDENSTDQIHVFKGEVVLRPHQSQSDALQISAGKASTVPDESESISSIDLEKERFIRRLEEPAYKYADIVMQNKPVVYFPMQPSVDGITLNDVSGQSIHGEIHDAIGRPLWTVGRIGTCIRFEGPTKKGFVVVRDYPKTTNNTLSGAAWVFAKSRPKWASIMKNWAGGPKHGQFHFGLYDYDGTLEVHIEDADGQEVFAKEDIPLPLNEWHHVAFVADGKHLILYRNGKEVDRVKYTSIHTNPEVTALAIGTKLNYNLTFPRPDHMFRSDWHGKLDELSLFNSPLSPETIKQLYDAGMAEMTMN